MTGFGQVKILANITLIYELMVFVDLTRPMIGLQLPFQGKMSCSVNRKTGLWQLLGVL